MERLDEFPQPASSDFPEVIAAAGRKVLKPPAPLGVGILENVPPHPGGEQGHIDPLRHVPPEEVLLRRRLESPIESHEGDGGFGPLDHLLKVHPACSPEQPQCLQIGDLRLRMKTPEPRLLE